MKTQARCSWQESSATWRGGPAKGGAAPEVEAHSDGFLGGLPWEEALPSLCRLRLRSWEEGVLECVAGGKEEAEGDTTADPYRGTQGWTTPLKWSYF